MIFKRIKPTLQSPIYWMAHEGDMKYVIVKQTRCFTRKCATLYELSIQQAGYSNKIKLQFTDLETAIQQAYQLSLGDINE